VLEMGEEWTRRQDQRVAFGQPSIP